MIYVRNLILSPQATDFRYLEYARSAKKGTEDKASRGGYFFENIIEIEFQYQEGVKTRKK